MSELFRLLFKSCLIILLANLWGTNLYAQSITDVRVTVNVKNVTMRTVLEEIEKSSSAIFTGNVDILDRVKLFTFDFRNESIGFILRKLFADYPIGWTITGDNISLKKDERKPVSELKANIGFTLNGVVITNGNPVPGVTVKVNGKVKVTDGRGEFTFKEVQSGDNLKVHHMSYKDQSIVITDNKRLYIVLVPNENSLAETVVIAYGTASKRNLTGSVGQLKARYIEKQPVANPLQAMQGRVPGVVVNLNSGIPGGSIDVQIRGPRSIRNTSQDNGNAPLYIIDDVPYTSAQISSVGGSPYPVFTNKPSVGISLMNNINPADIASIEVLKDADATAIYGSRGANGVVLITTKKGIPGGFHLDATLYKGWGRVTRTMKLLNTPQYLEMREEALKNDGKTPDSTDYDINGTWDRNRYTDWQKKLIGETAHSQDAYLSISGGNPHVQYMISGGYHKETTVYPGDYGNTRGTAHFSINTESDNKKLKSSLTASYAHSQTSLMGQDYTLLAITLAPNAPALFDAQGKINWQNNTFKNPLSLTGRPYFNTVQGVVSNTQISYEIFNGLTVTNSFGLVHNSVDEINKRYKSAVSPAMEPRSRLSAMQQNGAANSWIEEPQIKYRRAIGEGILNVLVGATFQQERIDLFTKTGSGFLSEADMNNIDKTADFVHEEKNSLYKYNAAFARLGFNLQDRYILNLSFRRDASSRFGSEKQQANFGAIGAGWIFSEEAFVQKYLPFVNFGKLRISYGTTGSDQIPDYGYQDSYITNDNTSYQGEPGMVPGRVANPYYGWELNTKFETAIELGLLHDIMALTVAYYRNLATDQLIGASLPATAGFPTVQYNVDAGVLNKGVELTFKSNNIRRKKFSWSTSLNLTIPRNKLLYFPNLVNSPLYGDLLEIGQPITITKLYHNMGVNTQTGIYNIEDINRDGFINGVDRKTYKNTGRQYYGGLQNELSWKSFELDIFFQFVKQLGYNYLYFTAQPGVFNQNQPVSVLDRWRKPGDIATVQKFSTNADAGDVADAQTRLGNSDPSVTDASYIRLQNLSLAYTVPLPKKWTDKIGIKVFVRGQNLITITKYKGLDPENFSIGLPPLKMITTGFSVKM